MRRRWWLHWNGWFMPTAMGLRLNLWRRFLAGHRYRQSSRVVERWERSSTEYGKTHPRPRIKTTTGTSTTTMWLTIGEPK